MMMGFMETIAIYFYIFGMLHVSDSGYLNVAPSHIKGRYHGEFYHYFAMGFHNREVSQ